MLSINFEMYNYLLSGNDSFKELGLMCIKQQETCNSSVVIQFTTSLKIERFSDIIE